MIQQENPTQASGLEMLEQLLHAHHEAVSNHDLQRVLDGMAPSVMLLGTAPSAMWIGREKVGEALREMFTEFDRGTRSFQHLFFDGHVIGDMAWAATMSKGSFTRGGDLVEYGTNLSLTFERVDGRWLIQLLHFSMEHMPQG